MVNAIVLWVLRSCSCSWSCGEHVFMCGACRTWRVGPWILGTLIFSVFSNHLWPSTWGVPKLSAPIICEQICSKSHMQQNCTWHIVLNKFITSRNKCAVNKEKKHLILFWFFWVSLCQLDWGVLSRWFTARMDFKIY